MLIHLFRPFTMRPAILLDLTCDLDEELLATYFTMQVTLYSGYHLYHLFHFFSSPSLSSHFPFLSLLSSSPVGRERGEKGGVLRLQCQGGEGGGMDRSTPPLLRSSGIDSAGARSGQPDPPLFSSPEPAPASVARSGGRPAGSTPPLLLQSNGGPRVSGAERRMATSSAAWRGGGRRAWRSGEEDDDELGSGTARAATEAPGGEQRQAARAATTTLGGPSGDGACGSRAVRGASGDAGRRDGPSSDDDAGRP